MERVRILIKYRSGQGLVVEVDDLKVRYSTIAGEMRLTKMEWTAMVPNPLFLNIEAIESVWELPANENATPDSSASEPEFGRTDEVGS